jgi:hypothetical protein
METSASLVTTELPIRHLIHRLVHRTSIITGDEMQTSASLVTMELPLRHPIHCLAPRTSLVTGDTTRPLSTRPGHLDMAPIWEPT